MHHSAVEEVAIFVGIVVVLNLLLRMGDVGWIRDRLEVHLSMRLGSESVGILHVVHVAFPVLLIILAVL